MGCSGGWYYWAWTYAETKALMDDQDYPYTSGASAQTGNCKYKAKEGKVTVVTQTMVDGNIDAIKAAIALQPCAVAISAGNPYFMNYSSGVLTSAVACGTRVDHAVTAVGYGTDPDFGPFYLVRNSWGTTWGENGYVRIGISDGKGTLSHIKDILEEDGYKVKAKKGDNYNF